MERDQIRTIVEEILRQLGQSNGRLGYTEPEAAALLGVAPHVLRDARLRGEIKARKVGKRFVYSRDELAAFLRGEPQ